jgi:predicted RecA/RadA family phage recombinase
VPATRTVGQTATHGAKGLQTRQGVFRLRKASAHDLADGKHVAEFACAAAKLVGSTQQVT